MDEEKVIEEAGEGKPETEEMIKEIGLIQEEIEESPEIKQAEGSFREGELDELRDKYVRLLADFDNYKKRMLRDKEELIKYANEALIYEFLPSIDHLEIALKHSSGEVQQGLKEGVEITLREILRTLEKFGLKQVKCIGLSFDPEFHHAMSQVQRDDVEDNTVFEELRTGYTYRDKVLRPSLVVVSRRPEKAEEAEEKTEEDIQD